MSTATDLIPRARAVLEACAKERKTITFGEIERRVGEPSTRKQDTRHFSVLGGRTVKAVQSRNEKIPSFEHNRISTQAVAANWQVSRIVGCGRVMGLPGAATVLPWSSRP